MKDSKQDRDSTVNMKEARIGAKALQEALFWSDMYAGFFKKVMKGPVELGEGLDLANCARSVASSSMIYFLSLLPKEQRANALNSMLSDLKTFILEQSEGLFK